MADDLGHIENLVPEARQALIRGDDEARVMLIKTEKFIPYEKGNDILERLEELLREPKKPRMPGYLIVGDSGNGKTSILRKFCRTHPPTDGLDAEAVPVVPVEAPDGPDPDALYESVLEYLMVPFKRSDKREQKKRDVKYYLKDAGTRMLCVDELHNILNGTKTRQGMFLTALKGLTNQLLMPIVLAGTREALNAITQDDQIRSRYRPLFLPRWKMDKEYVTLLASIEKTLPLKKPSRLASPELAPEILERSHGLLGEIITLISEAAVAAIRTTKSERITLKEITESKYIRPATGDDYANLLGSP